IEEVLTFNNRYLIITNAYPHPDALYRNGFIHRRVKAYQEKGINIEIFVISPAYNETEKYTYEDVNVTRGNKHHLQAFLSTNSFHKILIHFVTKDMIDVIKQTTPKTPIIIWVHGFEAESWHRRWFNFLEDRTQLKRILNMADHYYIEQLELMNYLYQTNELNLTFVHISKWFKEHIAECDARAISQNSHIIPNIIDGQLFNYVEKNPEQRLKILSIRPYASRKYANDLSVKTVLELSKRPYFNSLQFVFYGEGKYFDETLAPLRKFKNVEINKGFLPQNEIADKHKEFGIFLCPTRLDSQGVSMCEAMSSGLIPISNDLTAIPEFVEHNRSGLLARPEDYVHMADLIERLYYNPEVFTRISRDAATDIRNKCDVEVVISQEIALLIDAHQEAAISLEQPYSQDAHYWYKMYEELEEQMKQMMHMTLDMDQKIQNSAVKKLKKELRYYKNFKHSIDVTLLGKIAKVYIKVKRKIKKIIS
ncbi:glycosyltransferase family 4 protein, partial [Gottfriedia acidiceleris]|uniref:glycosyltransferase family 4 protein n=1 Tax=Gottfriedia acidiceleris TaxID=371036 RepID=UPI003399259B